MKLLIVDDNASNRKLLRVTFEADGHSTLEAADGVEALQILAREKVDAVLSDILMPRMDGYRLCHEIRTTEHLRDLPFVIYTSTYTSPRDEKLALSIGADRYLKKPAPFEIILAALRGAIVMKHGAPRPEAWKEVEVLKEYSDGLVTKLEERNLELAKANERLTILDRAKSEFLSVISHEFRTQPNGLFVVGDLMIEGMSGTQKKTAVQAMFIRSRERMLSILEDVLLLTQIDVQGETFQGASVSSGYVLNRAIQRATAFAKSRDVRFAMLEANMGPVVGDQELLIRSLSSLLETGVKFSKKGESVDLTQEMVGDSIRIVIDSHSWTIPPTAMPKFFDVFSIGETLTPSQDLGLGPALAYRILPLFGASVGVANRDPAGIRLSVSLQKG
jgi:CheY-like chemotaxis protein